MTVEEKPVVHYTQATIDQALELLKQGIDLNYDVFASVVDELRGFRAGTDESSYTNVDLMAGYRRDDDEYEDDEDWDGGMWDDNWGDDYDDEN